MNDSSTKSCPLCCEQVSPKARKCPHCQHFLTKWALIAYHPLVAMLPVIILFSFIPIVFDQGKDFEEFRSQVHISHSELQFGDLHNAPTVAVIGTLKNDSKISWKDLTLEVKYFDKTHKLIDTKQSRDYFLMLRSKDSCAFKVSQPREFNSEDYASYEIQIVGAHDSRGFMQ